jgi:hypothetical protein
MQAFDRLQAPQATYGYPEMPLSGPYGSMYPQDELSRIKMRNRRFMSSCAQEMNPGMQQGMYCKAEAEARLRLRVINDLIPR